MVLPGFDAEVPRHPRPPGGRLVFTRDTLLWRSGVTLADILAAIPGVFIVRAGFVGQPEYVAYAGRGPAGVEYYWDGLPLAPLGGDSIYVDAAAIYLSFLRRVDVEILPASLRVYLVSERHDTPVPRSVVRVVSGDFKVAQYSGLFQKRWGNGVGLNLGANFVGSDGASGANRTDQAFDLWGRAEWMPRAGVGAVYQIRRQALDRDPVVLAAGGNAIPGRHGNRTDASLRLLAGTRTGWTGMMDLASSSWTGDSVVPNRYLRTLMATGRHEWAHGSAEVSGRLGDGPEQRTLELRAGWSPVAGIVTSAEGSLAQYTSGRAGRRANASLSLYRGPFSVTGQMAYRRAPQAPAVRIDSSRTTVDQAIRALIQTGALTLQGEVARRDAFRPLPFTDLRLVPQASPSPLSTWWIGYARLRPITPLTLEGWYAHPAVGSADFQPPSHSRTQLTFRSKFWRTFRSGAFDLKVQFAVDSWSAGTAGRTATGTVIPLPGLTFSEGFLSFRIVGFTAFYHLRNALNTRDPYIPGMPDYPRNAQTFGVKWEFTN